MKIKLAFFVFISLLYFLAGCQNKQQKEERVSEKEETEVFLKKGRETAMAAFNILSGNLNKAIQEGGANHAIEYCNLAASPLIDSLSKAQNAVIRRTSLKVRNPKNGTDPDERPVLEAFHEKERNGEELKPVVKRLSSRKVAFYAPISVNEFCLQCHGKPGETLPVENHEIIKKLYPNDKAIGYSDGDLRGMWSIRFESLVKEK